MAIDPLARLHIAYLSGTAKSLQHGYQPLATGSWQLSQVHAIQSGTPSLVSDAHGGVHVAFLENSLVGGTSGRPRHAYRCFYP